jgi:hypothetical protein
MTGPEHYQAAEQAIATALGATAGPERAALHAQLAEAHAALASAAATALVAINGTSGDGSSRFYLVPHDDRKSWEAAVTHV